MRLIGNTCPGFYQFRRIRGITDVSHLLHEGSVSNEIYKDASGQLIFYLWDGAGKSVSSGVIASANTWYHLVGTATNNGNMYFYINGTRYGPTAVGTIWASGDRYWIGRQNWIPYYDGSIDEVRIYNRALSQSEVANLYKTSLSQIKPSSQQFKVTSGLVGFWSFNGADMDWSQTIAEARDTSGQGNHGDVTNASGANLLTNADFESGFTGGVANSWAITSSASYTPSQDTGYGGGSSQKIEITDPGSWGLFFYQTPAFTLNKTYLWSFRYNTSVGAGTIYAQIVDGPCSDSCAHLIFDEALPSTNGSWVYKTFNFQWTDEYADELRFYSGSATGSYWVDNVQLNVAGGGPKIAIGKTGQALSFSASNVKIAEPTPDVFDFTSSGGFSQFMWFKKTTACRAVDNNSNEVFATRFGTGDALNTWWFGCNESDNTLTIDFFPASGGGSCWGGWCLTSPAAINDGLWHYAGWVYDGSTKDLRLYLDNAVASSTTTTFSGTFDSFNPICIGGYYGSACDTYEYNGLIDEVRVYNRALSQSEISELYKLGTAKFAPDYPQTNLLKDSSLVGYWSFNGLDVSNIANLAYDRSGSGNNGTMVNMATSSRYAIGKSGQALNFDGSNDYVNLGTPSSLNLSDNFSISAWVKVTAFSVQAGIVERGPSTPAQTIVIRADAVGGCSANGFVFRINDGTNNAENCADNKSTGTWYHVVMVVGARGAGGLKGYVNGIQEVLEDTSAVGAITLSGYNWNIGFNERAPKYLNGLIDEVRIYNRALSAGEVLQLYKASKPQ